MLDLIQGHWKKKKKIKGHFADQPLFNNLWIFVIKGINLIVLPYTAH